MTNNNIPSFAQTDNALDEITVLQLIDSVSAGFRKFESVFSAISDIDPNEVAENIMSLSHYMSMEAGQAADFVNDWYEHYRKANSKTLLPKIGSEKKGSDIILQEDKEEIATTMEGIYSKLHLLCDQISLVKESFNKHRGQIDHDLSIEAVFRDMNRSMDVFEDLDTIKEALGID